MLNLNTSPYNDDFNPQNNYLRILFRPSYAIQARELTQLQTAIQSQMGSFGSNIFTNGSRVLDAQLHYGNKANSLLVTDTTMDLNANITNIYKYFNIDPTVISLADLATISKQQGYVSARNGVKGLTFTSGNATLRVIAVYPNTSTASACIVCQSLSGVHLTDNTTYTSTTTGQTFTTILTNSVSNAAYYAISNGVFFINGLFVYVEQQTTIVSQFNNSPTVQVGLSIQDGIVTSDIDSSLLDPANGTTNFNAPGADRYQVNLILTTQPINTANPINSASAINYINLATLTNGTITAQNTTSTYSVINDTLAKRTYDEAGDFTVVPFGIQFRDHPTDPTMFQVGLEAGNAYVHGYQYQTIATTWINNKRARNTGNVVNNALQTTFGNYINMDSSVGTFRGVPPVLIEDTVQLWNAVSGGAQVGTAKVRMLYRVVGTQYQMYLTDINMTSGSFSAIRTVKYASSQWDVSLSGGIAVLNNPTDNNLLFTQNYQTLTNFTSQTFSYIKQFTVVSALWVSNGLTGSSGANTASNIAPATGDDYLPPNDVSTFAPYIVVNNSTGAMQVITNVTVTAGGSVSITVANSAGGSLSDCTVYAPTFRAVSSPRTKTLNTNNITIPATGATSYNLVGLSSDVGGARNYYDIQNIVHIYNSAAPTVDIASSFALNGGQTDNYYGVGSITWIGSGAAPSAVNLSVVFSSFDHSNDPSGTGYFTVNSYNSVSYATIPSYTSSVSSATYALSDVIDFRPTINDTVGIPTFKSQALPIPFGFGSEFIASYAYYLPRNDKIVLTKDQQFIILNGVPSLKPITPDSLSNAMTLYTLSIPAYTFHSTDVTSLYVENKRYTMRDIGGLDSRIGRVEYYTSLTLLEKQTNDTVILDPNGTTAFKNAISVDEFAGHSIGNVTNPEYKCAIDYDEQILRPSFVSRNYGMGNPIGGTVSSANILTLPYTTSIFIDQPLASGTIGVVPCDVSSWIGHTSLVPSSDVWYDQTNAPVVVQNVAKSNNNWSLLGAGAFGTAWNDWTNNWAGKLAINSLTDSLITSSLFNANARTGMNKSVLSLGMSTTSSSKVVNNTVAHHMRQIPISFAATGMKPFTVVNAYFDSVAVVTSPSVLTTDATGAISGTFTIPAGVKVGTRVFLLTDTTPNDVNATTTSFAQFTSNGATTTLNKLKPVQTPSLTAAAPVVSFPVDPLAESFTISAKQYPNGLFLSSIDLYFSTKSSTLPIALQIRPMENGFPSATNAIPLSEVILAPSQVNIAVNQYNPQITDHTRFQFPAPIYLAAGDYCFTLNSATTEYQVYVGTMGDNVYSSNNIISKQPNVGTMFKPQSAATWTSTPSTDLMFRLNQCVFSSSANVTFTNTTNSFTDTFNYALMNVNPASTEFSTASIAWQKQGIPLGSSLESLSSINTGVNLELPSLYQIQGSATNQFGLSATLSTNDTNISPIIELNRLSVILVENVINNFSLITNETGYNTGNALAKYVSTPVTLAAGFESSGLNIAFDAYLPGISDVYVYYKTANTGAQVNFTSMGWTLLSGTSGSIQSNASRLDSDVNYTTYTFKTPNTIPLYNIFAVKLVMVGDALNVPNIKDLQLVAYS